MRTKHTINLNSNSTLKLDKSTLAVKAKSEGLDCDIKIFKNNMVATPTDKTPTGNKVSAVKNFLKAGVLFFTLIFSLNAFARMTVINCLGNPDQESHDIFKKTVYAKNPGNIHVLNATGISALCVGNITEGITFLKRSSDGGHVESSFYVARYYETDKTLDHSRDTTKDSENFNAALFYYKRAVKLIESNPNYPEDNDPFSSMPEMEKNNHTSAKVFSGVIYLYFVSYIDALLDIINSVEKMHYTDTIEVLKQMGNFSERCLQRPSLSIWGAKQSRIYRAMRVRCQAVLDFVEQVYTLEQERMDIAKSCSVPIKECAKHKNIINKKIAPLTNKTVEALKSVSL